jgi:hypothetical protein
MPACYKADNVIEGIEFGEGFNRAGLSSKEQVQISGILDRYGRWINQYGGGIPAPSIAQGIAHESNGNPVSTSDKTIRESGLWSVTKGVAEELDIDPFDPEANIWAGARLRNDRVRRMMENDGYGWLSQATAYDWTKLAYKLPGSLGYGGWKILMKKVFPSEPQPGSSKAQQPYQYMLNWIYEHPGKVPGVGRIPPGSVACRAVRHAGVDYLSRRGALSRPGHYRVLTRPAHFPRYSAKKFNAVWATAKSKRPAKFPEYMRESGGGGGLLPLIIIGILMVV